MNRFADALSQFQTDNAQSRDPFAPLAESAAEYERWLTSLPVMSEAEEAAFAREYAEAECATGRFEQQFPHLAD